MKKYLWRIVGVVTVLYLALVAVRTVHFVNQARTDEQVAKIHATKLRMDDVMGKNLPIALAITSQAMYDATVQGLDANKNGIRDDVELAIFNAYPKSAKTRAVLLQYALALQLETTQPIVNTDTVTAVAEETSRSYLCVSNLTPRIDMNKFIEIGNQLRNFVEERQLNTGIRKVAQKDFYKNLNSGDVPLGSCDVELSSLLN